MIQLVRWLRCLLQFLQVLSIPCSRLNQLAPSSLIDPLLRCYPLDRWLQ